MELMVEPDRFRAIGRGTGIRGGMRDGVDSEGSVLECEIVGGPELAGMTDLIGWKPAR
jgi:hypothetical protein